MYFDLFLLSAALVTAYLGPMIVRGRPPGQRMFGWLLIADGAAALIALVLRNAGAGSPEGADLLGFVALAAAVCLIMVPPILRDLARRAVMANRLGLARRLIDLRGHLQPGMGAERERELIIALMAVRSGQVDDAVAMLEDARERTTDAQAIRQLDERIVLTYLSARRWPDAVRAYERGLERGPLSPQLMGEMVRAYCEVGDMDAAAALVSYLESMPAPEDPVVEILLYRARLVFLAFAGRVQAVDALVAPDGPLGMLPAATRQFWSGMVRLRAGQVDSARPFLEEAVQLTRRDRLTHRYAKNLLESVDEPGVAGPHELSPEADELADRLAAGVASRAAEPRPAAKTPPQMSGVPWRQVPVTAGLILVNLVAFALVLGLLGSTGDPGALVRAGANVKSAVRAGEWWRLVSSTFLHVGVLHLAINMYALWILGKLVEQMYGPARTLALYTVAGLVGALASVLGGPGISAGASGAVLGLLGALIAELGVRRSAYPGRWRKVLFGNLVFVAVAQVAIGFFYPAIDQSAHVGGLLSGAVAALVLSPHSSVAATRGGRAIAGLFVTVAALALGYGLWGVATTDYGDTLARYGAVEHRAGALSFAGPAHWEPVGRGHYRDAEVAVELVVEVQPHRGSAGGRSLEQFLDLRIEAEKEELDKGEASVRGVPEGQRLATPEPWQSRALVYVHEGMGGEQRYRLIVFGRDRGGELWLGSAMVPEALAGDMQPVLARVMTSMRRQ